MTRVKICGLRSEKDAQLVSAAGADYAGLVFAPSKRQVDAQTARAIRAELSPGIQTVGVFVNAAIEDIAALCAEGTLDLVQLHGDEDAAYIAALRARTDKPIIRAVAVGDALPAIPQGADYLLFDTRGPARGGNGQSFDWRLLAGFAGPPFFLAGGLHPGNVAAALHAVRPHCVDVSSGVETGGAKDEAKVLEFVKQVREMSE